MDIKGYPLTSVLLSTGGWEHDIMGCPLQPGCIEVVFALHTEDDLGVYDRTVEESAELEGGKFEIWNITNFDENSKRMYFALARFHDIDRKAAYRRTEEFLKDLVHRHPGMIAGYTLSGIIDRKNRAVENF
jgi:hypothetical protein